MSKSEYVIIVGNGHLAKCFFDNIENISREKYNIHLIPISFNTLIQTEKKDPLIVSNKSLNMLLHIGSGRQLEESITFCQKYQIPLIQGASGIKSQLPNMLNFPYIEAPNLSVPIIKFMTMLRKSGYLFKNSTIQITESHQKTKNTVPETAIHLANFLSIKKTNIKSIRDPQIQKKKYKIPDKFLTGHAYHEIAITEKGGSLKLSTSVWGRDTYIYGVLEINKIKYILKNKKYHIADLVDQGLI